MACGAARNSTNPSSHSARRSRTAGSTTRPSATASVSDEYFPVHPATDGAVALAMAHTIVREGLADRASLVHEHLTAVRRAGADILITYHARRALREGWLD